MVQRATAAATPREHNTAFLLAFVLGFSAVVSSQHVLMRGKQRCPW
jgi:hypothetical protein